MVISLSFTTTPIGTAGWFWQVNSVFLTCSIGKDAINLSHICSSFVPLSALLIPLMQESTESSVCMHTRLLQSLIHHKPWPCNVSSLILVESNELLLRRCFFTPQSELLDCIVFEEEFINVTSPPDTFSAQEFLCCWLSFVVSSSFSAHIADA